jgi:predicted TIM-barrel fold metal-dependent hydrolase
MVDRDKLDFSKFGNVIRRGTTFLPEPTPLPLWCPVLSVDDHVLEPPNIFVDRVPSALRDKVPHVTYDDEGVPTWQINGKSMPLEIVNGAVGRPMSEWDFSPQKYDEMREGVWNPLKRVSDMHLDGVYASVVFPSTLFGFGGRVFAHMEDREVGLACLRAWNDWMIDEWCAAAPLAYVPGQLTWLNDPELAALEIRKNAERGFKAVSFSENPEGLGLPTVYSPYWDPFFAACEETETVINLHIGSSGQVQRPTSDSPREVSTALFPVNGMFTAIDWVFARIPVKYPKLKVVLSEAGASWVPMVIERLARTWRQVDAMVAWSRDDGDPVDAFRRIFWFASIEDPCAFRELDVIGEDRVMVESDYPHFDSTWPETQTMIESELQNLSPVVVRKLCFENAAKLYRHPLPPEEMLTHSKVGRMVVA